MVAVPRKPSQVSVPAYSRGNFKSLWSSDLTLQMIVSGSGFKPWQGTVFWPQDRLEGYGSSEVLPRGSAYLLGGGHHISHSRDVGVPPSTSLLDVSHETPTKHYYDRVIGVGGEQSGPLATHTRYVVK